MAEQLGFLEQLGIGDTDERAAAAQARMLQRDPHRALGMGARRGFGAVVGGVHGLVTGESTHPSKGGRSIKGFLSNMGTGADVQEDIDAAVASGISVDELLARRHIRQELGKEDYNPQEGETDLDAKLRMAASAASIAGELGVPELQAAALQQLSILREEKAEWDKWQADEQAKRDKEAREKDEHDREGIKDAFDPSGTATTGMLEFDKERGLWGLRHADDGGISVFTPFSNSFSLHDPDKGKANETIDQRIRRAFSKEEVRMTRNLVSTNAQALRKIGRVMDSVKGYVDTGMDEAIMGGSGPFIAAIDNGIRNVRGALSAFLPFEKNKGAKIDMKADPEGTRAGRSGNGWSGWGKWMERAGDANDALWSSFNLPEWARGASAEAQEHRAQILELAYMAARLAEPSNRGLSDKDIEAALARIAGDTSNPQQLMRRFMTIAADAAMDLEDNLKLYKTALPDVTDEEIERYFGGQLLVEYRQRRDDIYNNFGVTFNEYGRPIFEEYVDYMVEPGSNEVVPKEAKAEIESLSDEEAAAELQSLGLSQ